MATVESLCIICGYIKIFDNINIEGDTYNISYSKKSNIYILSNNMFFLGVEYLTFDQKYMDLIQEKIKKYESLSDTEKNK